jgi:ATP-binding cassette, subfamily B, bacterial
LGHALTASRLGRDVETAGGVDALIGHRGVRLSGGQAQRLALARALATDSELLVADDISSALDAATELELWAALRARGQTVIGSTTKAAALALADRVVILAGGQVIATGRWADLAPQYDALAG